LTPVLLSKSGGISHRDSFDGFLPGHEALHVGGTELSPVFWVNPSSIIFRKFLKAGNRFHATPVVDVRASPSGEPPAKGVLVYLLVVRFSVSGIERLMRIHLYASGRTAA